MKQALCDRCGQVISTVIGSEVSIETTGEGKTTVDLCKLCSNALRQFFEPLPRLPRCASERP